MSDYYNIFRKVILLFNVMVKKSSHKIGKLVFKGNIVATYKIVNVMKPYAEYKNNCKYN